jgi:Flp pilus assembly protein TadD
MINAIINAENLAQKGHLPEAYAAFTEILEKDPKNARSLMGLGVVCFKSSKYQEAIATFTKVLDIKTNHLEALKSLAMVHAADKDLDKAVEFVDKLVSLRPKDHDMFSFAARILFSLGQKKPALVHIEKALELTANNYLKQAEYNDLKASITGLPLPSKVKQKLYLTVCCTPGMDNFIHDSIKRLSLYANTTTSISAKLEDHIKNIINANVVWLEWGSS